MKRAWILNCWLTLWLGAIALNLHAEPFGITLETKKYALILVGASPDEKYGERYRDWGLELSASLQRDYQYPRDNIIVLIGNEAKDPIIGITGPNKVESIETEFARLAGKITAADQLTVFLIGQGNGRDENAKFNIVGPDITGADFAERLDTIKTDNIVVINTTSSSYGFTKALAAPGRVLVSATRSGAEKYDIVFVRHLIDSMNFLKGDRDKNGRLSVLEAFYYANTLTKEFFENEGRLPTEHAVLDSNGDGVFTPTPAQEEDGRLAEIAFFNAVTVTRGELPGAALKLKTEIDDLERRVFSLRANKSTYSDDDYWAQMEPLLIELARLSQRFEAQR